jgi:predicted DNA-binding protein (MmcQ/YjbR family)
MTEAYCFARIRLRLRVWLALGFWGAIPDDEILEVIDASYAMVVSKLPKRTARRR